MISSCLVAHAPRAIALFLIYESRKNELALPGTAAHVVRILCDAALGDENGAALDKLLASLTT